MKSSISYKSCLIRGESFQPRKMGCGCAVYLRRQDTKNKVSDFDPSSSTRKTFATESARRAKSRSG